MNWKLTSGMNTWVHSLALITVGTPLLAVTRWATTPFASMLADVCCEPGAAMEFLFAPLLAMSLLVPGLLVGWHTRRHPLLVGAAVGAAGSAVLHVLPGEFVSSAMRAGDVVFAALVVAVAALAGRALRWRFRPAPTDTAMVPR
jgi:hypothetical protein